MGLGNYCKVTTISNVRLPTTSLPFCSGHQCSWQSLVHPELQSLSSSNRISCLISLEEASSSSVGTGVVITAIMEDGEVGYGLTSVLENALSSQKPDLPVGFFIKQTLIRKLEATEHTVVP